MNYGRSSLVWLAVASRSSRAFVYTTTKLRASTATTSPSRLRLRPRLVHSVSKRDITHDDDDSNSNSDIAQRASIVEAETRRWIRRVVVGLNLCPFAERPLRTKQLRVMVVSGTEECVLPVVRTELHRLADPNMAVGTTTVVACPDLYPDDFESYLQTVISPLDDTIRNHPALLGHVQVAPFHPKFVFDGSSVGDPDVHTNTAPYPLVHILREVDVSDAVDRLHPTGDDDEGIENTDDSTNATDNTPAAAADAASATVWSRNVDLLEALADDLTPTEFATVVHGHDTTSSLRHRVRRILARFPIALSSSSKPRAVHHSDNSAVSNESSSKSTSTSSD